MDEETKVTTVATEEPADEPKQGNTPEEMQAELAKYMTEVKRMKTALDKASSDAAKWKKEALAHKSDAEQLSIEKAERDAEIQAELAALRKESAVNKFAKSFIAMGYTEDQAMKAAEAQYGGDTDELFRIQAAHQEEYAKKIQAEIMRSMPAPSTGNDDNVQITKEQFNDMSYSEQVKFKREHPTAYDRLVN